MLSVGPVKGSGSTTWQYIADVDACLRLVARVGHYDGIIDGLTRCCDWVWTACLVFVMVNDGLWVTGVVAVSVVGPGTCVVVTLAVFTKFTPASISACVAV